MPEEFYDGLPVVELLIAEVDVPDPIHLCRSLRYPGAFDIEPVAAIEAALDSKGLITRDLRSRTGEAIRAIGYSSTTSQILVVVLLPHEHPPAGRWHVATAWPASRHERTMYADEQESKS